MDPVLRWMSARLGRTTVVRASVNDLAFVIHDLLGALPALHYVSAILAASTGLALRIDKCWTVLFNGTRTHVVHEFVRQSLPS